MKTKLHSAFRIPHSALLLAVLSTLNYQPSTFAQGTAFTYQGRLNDTGQPANGSYDLSFSLYTGSSGGVAAFGPLINPAVAVTDGLFTVLLDFGPGVFDGTTYWLDISVRTNGTDTFIELDPRQQVTPAPYAIFSENAGLANSVTANSVSAAGLDTLGAPASGQVLSYSGGSLVWTDPSAGGSGWSLTGNGGTTGANFLGTTDSQPLDLRVNNERALDLYQGNNNTITLTVGPFTGSLPGGQGISILASGYAGAANLVYSDFSTIAGGYDGQILAGSGGSVIAGGFGHRITGGTGAIGGGGYNTISGSATAGTIPGGANNLVTGDYGFAAGNAAQAIHSGAFVWADNSGGAFASTANNQFSARALGGVQFVTGGAGLTIDNVTVWAGGGGDPNSTAIGNGALLSHTTGFDNTAIGYEALFSNTSGDGNTATGSEALRFNMSGSGNTANGAGALYTNTTGDRNTANGSGALASNTTGGVNTANGAGALNSNTNGSYNTANGEEALYYNTMGNGNTANGYQTLYSNTNGSYNTADGDQALYSNTSGSGNIALGFSAGGNLDVGNNNIDIGNQGAAGDDSTIKIGTQGTQTSTFIAGISGATLSPSGAPVYVNSAGQLGTINSSARFKQDIRSMADASDVLLALRPVTFRYKPELDPKGTPQFGLVAEEVDQVDPDLVLRDQKDEIYTVRYEAVNAMLLNEFQKEHRKVEEQSDKMEKLEAENDQLKARLEKLEQLMNLQIGGAK